MAKQYYQITVELARFIERQKMFFVATAAADGWINLSPKGMDSFRIVDTNSVIWLNLTGSGNETAAHLLSDPRMTIMFCAFEGDPLILRLYGNAQVIHPRDMGWRRHIELFGDQPGARQIIVMQIVLVQTSCGFAVPLYEYQGDRTLLADWANKKGREGIEKYWFDKNQLSLDGKPTGIFESPNTSNSEQ